ncbi:hypothetical protein, partial [Salmonella enterica]|uniref:hypothetical protein n=1 Tax=Salmonella enterica TaxID=28901 RepID=UPI001ADB43FD
CFVVALCFSRPFFCVEIVAFAFFSAAGAANYVGALVVLSTGQSGDKYPCAVLSPFSAFPPGSPPVR